MHQNTEQETGESAEIQVEQTNSATRLYALIEKAQRQNSGISTLEAWAITFGVEPSVASANPHEVIDQLRLMHDEIGHLRRQMARTSFSADLYDPSLQKISNLLGITNLAAGWNSYVNVVRDQDLLALRWCSQAIENEIGLTLVELQALLDAINEFKNEVESQRMPGPAREFVLHQIELMIRGVHQYPIIGPRAAREAVRRAAGEVVNVDENVADAMPAGYWARAGKFWNTLLTRVEGCEKMVNAVARIAETVPKITNAVSNATNLIP
jgi:hypothetical protein